MRYILVILAVISLHSSAESINDCARLRGYEQDLCLAVAKLDIKKCESMASLTQRENCIRLVVEEQRRVLRRPREDIKR